MRNAYKEHLRVERLHAGDPDALMTPQTKGVGTESGGIDKIPAQANEVGGSND